jgi:hypothetical protein
MGCSGCPGKKTTSPTAQRPAYLVGEKGFVEIRYNGWVLPYRIYGEKQLYTFDELHRIKYVDKRDADILLSMVEDGVKVFDKV